MDVVEFYEEVEHVRNHVHEWEQKNSARQAAPADTLALLFRSLQTTGNGERFRRAGLASRSLEDYHYGGPVSDGPLSRLPEFLVCRAAFLAFSAEAVRSLAAPDLGPGPHRIRCRAVEIVPEPRRSVCRGEEVVEPLVLLRLDPGTGGSPPEELICSYPVAALCLFLRPDTDGGSRPTSWSTRVHAGKPRTVPTVPIPSGKAPVRKRPRSPCPKS